MSTTAFILIAITYYILAIIVIVIVLNMIASHEKKVYSKEITGLERDKNLIISASILAELNKVETLLNNDKMVETFNEWQSRFKEIKDKEVPKLTDQLIEIEELFNNKKYKELKAKLAKVELNIYYIKTRASFLLKEIQEITLSEERNRETITKIKSIYRDVLTKYNNNQGDYKDVSGPLQLQFENVDKLFGTFEIAMDNNSYTEAPKIVKAIDDIVGNLSIVIEEAPSIIMMGKSLIPQKMTDVTSIVKRLTKDGFNLEFLNVEYNIEESEKKIKDIFARLNVLNVEDSIFELKTISDYFDGLYNDFDKERIAKKVFEEYTRSIIVKVLKLEKINNELSKRVGSIKYSYDVRDDEFNIIDTNKNELKLVKEDYDRIIGLHRSKMVAYSKLSKEMELLNIRLTKAEDNLETALRSFGSLKEDELRAREQLDEIKDLLKKTKNKINSFKLPITPKKYYVELSEATGAIKEINRELDKKPISISVLNTRVDTARDLVLKLYATSKEITKTAWMAELAIVYGNRYRSINKEIDNGLSLAESDFFKGNYKSSLESAISAINIVEPGIHKRLLESYEN